MSNSLKGKNDLAWEALFEKYDILATIERDGAFQISADQIREFREPRLMAKFDHRINLPQIFLKNQLSILPISRGDYVISHFDAYHTFEPSNATARRVSLPSHIQSLEPQRITSEAVAINCALLSGILSDFLGEANLAATVSGRMGSDTFSFEIANTKTGLSSLVEVKNAQIEIDAAFEGSSSLCLLEAKRDLSEDFLVRQLYYPFRVWRGRTYKKVRPVFLVYCNGIFHLYEYEFTNSNAYHSLVLIQQKNYILEEDTHITAKELAGVLAGISIMPEPEISFPQANSFLRVVNLCELLMSRPLTQEEVTGQYAFDIRQTNYYTDAGRYLGLIEKSKKAQKPFYRLTQRGKCMMGMNYKQRQLALCRCILEHRVFYDAFALYLHTGMLPTEREIVTLMKRSHLYRITKESTFRRRASSIAGWLKWMTSLSSDMHEQRLF